MYAAGRIPGSFFRREGRPSEDAILTCRLIDRPLRPSLRQGPAQRGPGRRDRPRARPAAPVRRRRDQRRVDVDQAVRPAVLRPDRGDPDGAHRRPLGGLPDPRGAGAGHLRHGRRRPGPARRRRRDHDGRGRGHRAHDRAGRRRRADADRGGRRQRPGGRQAGHPRAVPGPGRAGRGRGQAGRRVPGLPRVPGRRLRRGRRAPSATRSPRRCKIAGKAEREEALDRIKDQASRARRRRSSRGARRRSAPRSGR